MYFHSSPWDYQISTGTKSLLQDNSKNALLCSSLLHCASKLLQMFLYLHHFHLLISKVVFSPFQWTGQRAGLHAVLMVHSRIFSLLYEHPTENGAALLRTGGSCPHCNALPCATCDKLLPLQRSGPWRTAAQTSNTIQGSCKVVASQTSQLF